MTTRKLGKWQRMALEYMARPGTTHSWHAGSGWGFDNFSSTARVMRSLHRRGLVDLRTGRDEYRLPLSVWTINDAGRAALKAR